MTSTVSAALLGLVAAQLLGPMEFDARLDARPIASSVVREATLLGISEGRSEASAPHADPPGHPGPHRDWSAVGKLEPGTEILVTADGRRARWYFGGNDDVSLTLIGSTDRQPIRVARDHVVEVRARSRHFTRDFRRGVVAGAAVATTLVGLYACHEDECAAGVGAGLLFGSVFGAGLGSMLGTMPPRSFELVYRGAVTREAAQLSSNSERVDQQATVPVAQQASPTGGWLRLQGLRPGREMVVMVKGSEAATFRFLTSDASGVTMLSPSDLQHPISVRRDDVSEIRVWARHRARYVWLGALIGAVAVGTAYGKMEERSRGCRERLYNSCDPGEYARIGAWVGANLGAAVGGVVAILQPRHTDRIYRGR